MPASRACERTSPEAISCQYAKLVRSYLEDITRRTERNVREYILKDITTVRNDPQRIDQWAAIAMEAVKNA